MSRTDRTPRRRLDPIRRQSEIQAVAAGTFASQPYEQVSMAEIAGQAQASEALLYRYFGSKPQLYTEILRTALDEIRARQQTAVAALGPGATTREELRALVDTRLDYLMPLSPIWATALITTGNDPAEARVMRIEVREQRLAALRGLGGLTVIDDYALHGFLGFVDAACLAWVERGCPAGNRDQLVQASVNALLGPADDPRPEAARRGKFGRR
ncbi:TetR/AcrR family transcriptional regulator [Brooklawnia sp.]|uniref:TetR/AcrR family transcriptional regulator n=1 Tax=Brooklawnia sp. TaxID=2699740 RepID=UPI00311F531B